VPNPLQYKNATYRSLRQWLPPLPANAHLVWHQQSCHDWGLWGWLLRSSNLVQLHNYK
jgi:hypothetical protein